MLAERTDLSAAPVPGMPTDRPFNLWTRSEPGLVWLPSRGMGRLRVNEAPYDEAYFAKYQGYARTEQGKKITAARVDLVRQHTDGHVIDVGIGCGDFINTRLGWTWGYDVNPEAVQWLHAQGRWRNPYEDGPHNAISLWDVLEHIPEPQRLLDNVARFVFVSLPIVPGEGPPSPTWKHYRTDEHCWYWTHTGFVRWMKEHGFTCQHMSHMETLLGREDIGSYVFERTRK